MVCVLDTLEPHSHNNSVNCWQRLFLCDMVFSYHPRLVLDKADFLY